MIFVILVFQVSNARNIYKMRGHGMKLCSENVREEIIGIVLILIGVTLRVLPHEDNFTPVTAIALFSGVVLSPAVVLTVPLIVMIASDLLIGPHPLYGLTWGCFLLVSLMGLSMRRSPKARNIFFGTLAGSVLFYGVTNLGVFLFQGMYPKNFQGFVECFVMALPFFRNSLLGDLFYTAVFFGLFAAAKNFSHERRSQEKNPA